MTILTRFTCEPLLIFIVDFCAMNYRSFDKTFEKSKITFKSKKLLLNMFIKFCENTKKKKLKERS